MIRILQSNWVVTLVGALVYLGSTVFFLPGPGHWLPPSSLNAVGLTPPMMPSWDYLNPDFDRLLQDVKERQSKLEQRESELKELEARLNSERLEINAATQLVARLQAAYDKDVNRFKESEVVNLKRLAKTHAAMSPDGS